MTISAPKRLLTSALALGIAASAFTVLPGGAAFAAPAENGTAYSYLAHPNAEKVYAVTSNVPTITVKSHEQVSIDLKPYIKNADDFTVLVRGLPQGLKYDLDSRTISGSTVFAQDYTVSVFLKGRRDKLIQNFTLKVAPSYSDPADYPRNTDNPNLNRLPHFRR